MTVGKKAMDLFAKKCKVRNNWGFIPFISNLASTPAVYQLCSYDISHCPLYLGVFSHVSPTT